MQDNVINKAVIVSDLSVKFGDFTAVDNISFEVKKGEIFGFLGANGAGKTTTIRVLCGLLNPSQGNVVVAGIDFNSEAREMDIKQKVGYMSQRFTLYNDLTVEENLSFIASLRNIDPKIYLKRRDLLLNFISFQKPLDSFVRDLSGGIKQQVSLAASMLHDPEIIFLDEPTAGVTPTMRFRFWELIRDLSKLGKTIFVTTHYMDEAEQCERIALMNTGRIIAINSPEHLKKQAFTEQMYEFDPVGRMSYEELNHLRENEDFDFFEPYGHRFHAVFKKTDNVARLKEKLQQNFTIKQITPTLEDVFLKMVEAGKS